MSNLLSSICGTGILYFFLSLPFLPSIAAQDLGGIYTSADGGFSISIEGRPTSRQPVFEQFAEYTLVGDTFLWERDDETIAIQICQVHSRTSSLSRLQKAAVIDTYKKIITGGFTKYRIGTTEKPYKVLEGVGVEIRSVPPKLVSRVFFLNERLIVLSVVRSQDSGADLQLELLDSFRVLPKDQHIAVLIRENMPGPLPQEGRAASMPPDTATMGLRSEVMQIVETFQETPTSEKERAAELYFDKNGNLTKEILYAAGYPNQVRTWGWVEGGRVSRSTTINYLPNQILSSNHSRRIIDGSPGPLQVVGSSSGSIKFKPPYGLKYEFTTDSVKRVTERRVFSGNGDLSFVEKMAFTPTSIETRVTDGSGGFMSRMLEVVDKNGFTTEEKTLDSAGKPVASRYFSYELDVNSNWVTKRVFTKHQTRRSVIDKPKGIYSRLITYY